MTGRQAGHVSRKEGVARRIWGGLHRICLFFGKAFPPR